MFCAACAPSAQQHAASGGRSASSMLCTRGDARSSNTLHRGHGLGGSDEVVEAALLAQLDARLVPVLAVLPPAPDIRHLHPRRRAVPASDPGIVGVSAGCWRAGSFSPFDHHWKPNKFESSLCSIALFRQPGAGRRALYAQFARSSRCMLWGSSPPVLHASAPRLMRPTRDAP